MRPVLVSLGAVGASPIVPVNFDQNAFSIGLAGRITSGASLTWGVQHCYDNPFNTVADGGNVRQVSIARTTTTATVTDPDHRLTTGDTIVVYGAGAPFDTASAAITFIDANSYSYTVANSGLAASAGGWLGSMRWFNHPTLVTKASVSAEGSYVTPIRSLRLICTVWVSGKVDLMVLQGMA